MAELAQGFGFDLADALASDLEALADLFEGVLGAVFEAEAHLDDPFLARSKSAEDLRGVLLEVDADDRLGGRDRLAIFDEVAEVRVFLFADGGFELGSCAILSTLRTLATGMSMRRAISSLVGSRPSSCTNWRLVRMSLLMVSIMCTGMRMVRAWSAMARVMAWRIHQVA
jgi:hypothetical protein